MSTAMSKRLEGKTILITGASSGIGKSTALEFARTAPKNLKLILTARRLEALEQLKSDINKEVGEGVKVLPVKLDISNPKEVREFVGKLPEEFKEIHVLVNNAGLVKGVAKAPEIAEEDMNTMFATNVTGLINMTQAILPIFLARSGELPGTGDIINVGSIAGREPYPGGSIYCATKAAVRSFTDSLRKELIATRIRVMEIDPGQVETEFSVVRFYGDKSKADKVYEGCEPLTPDDIAEVVVFAAGRRENVVVADTLVFPNHQVSFDLFFRFSFIPLFCFFAFQSLILNEKRPLLRSCTKGPKHICCVIWVYMSDWKYNRLVLEEAIHTSALLNQKSRSRRWWVREKYKVIYWSMIYISWEIAGVSWSSFYDVICFLCESSLGYKSHSRQYAFRLTLPSRSLITIYIRTAFHDMLITAIEQAS
jgi:3-hydroxy acid dehydrogenase/malonic semialdehyde reductase